MPSPIKIPLGIAGHSGGASYNSPTNNVQNISLSLNASVVAPATCTPSMTVYNYSGSLTKYVLCGINGSTLTLNGTTIATCTIGNTTGGTTCTATGAPIAAGTVFTLTTNTCAAPATAGGNGFLIAFSCD